MLYNPPPPLFLFLQRFSIYSKQLRPQCCFDRIPSVYFCNVEYFRAKHLCDYNMIVHSAAGGVEALTTVCQHRDAVDGKTSRPAFVWAALCRSTQHRLFYNGGRVYGMCF